MQRTCLELILCLGDPLVNVWAKIDYWHHKWSHHSYNGYDQMKGPQAAPACEHMQFVYICYVCSCLICFVRSVKINLRIGRAPTSIPESCKNGSFNLFTKCINSIKIFVVILLISEPCVLNWPLNFIFYHLLLIHTQRVLQQWNYTYLNPFDYPAMPENFWSQDP